jgi:UDP-N-acetylmuramoyl-L-alanyl-D-glutamate--2,6-diaminopimelate ligase
MKLSDLIAGLDVRIIRGDPPRVRICDLTEDSRTVMPGSLFVARRGAHADGRRFVGDACELGAVAILSDDPEACSGGACERGAHHRDIGRDVTLVVTPDVPLTAARIAERFYGEPSSRLGVIGVTGTNGKTTIVHLIHRIMNESGIRCGMMGTVEIDDGREVATATMTTPPAIEVSRTLGMMVEHGCKFAAMEASSHALDQHRVGAVHFRVGIFTNLTGDHLDYHQTMEAYADAKARLFAGLTPEGWAIVNATDPAHERMLRDCGARVVRCVDRALTESERASTGWAGITILDRALSGTVARVQGPWGELMVRYGLIGAHNAMNVLQAVAACHAMGMAAHAIVEGLARASAPRGRLEPVEPPEARAERPMVLIDYAHTDDGLAKSLMAVREAMDATPGPGRLWVVFGAGGEKDRTKRPRMGRVASVIADRVIVTSDNPRRERPSAIVDEIIAGIEPEARKGRVEVQVDRQLAIQHAIEHARPGDVVVIAGKGHETEQILPDGSGGTVRIRFDDREVASAALRTLAGAE